MSLTHIHARKGKPSQMLERLSKIYRTFRGGQNTADLSDARAMLTASTVT